MKDAMTSIKVGRREYPVKKGDYILYNGACYQFITGDNRGLKFKGFHQYTSLVLPKIAVKKIPFQDMEMRDSSEEGHKLIKWIF